MAQWDGALAFQESRIIGQSERSPDAGSSAYNSSDYWIPALAGMMFREISRSSLIIRSSPGFSFYQCTRLFFYTTERDGVSRRTAEKPDRRTVALRK
jgi:hypothetical protein